MSGNWVCLMYHDVLAQSTGVTGGPAYFSVSAATFTRQLAMVADLGLRAGSIADALTDSTVRLAFSFDDGDLGQAERAFPILASRGMRATFFVTTAWVGTPGYASWEQLREMKAAGMSVQSHTHSHPFLSEIGAAALRDELRRSKGMIDEKLEQRTTMIALPGGDAPRRELRSIVVEEGYDTIATSQWGTNSRRGAAGVRQVKRCTVRGESPDDAFVAVVRGDRWLAFRKRTREAALSLLRSSVGPTRYARWRRELLNVAGAGSGHAV